SAGLVDAAVADDRELLAARSHIDQDAVALRGGGHPQLLELVGRRLGRVVYRLVAHVHAHLGARARLGLADRLHDALVIQRVQERLGLHVRLRSPAPGGAAPAEGAAAPGEPASAERAPASAPAAAGGAAGPTAAAAPAAGAPAAAAVGGPGLPVLVRDH